MWRHLLELLVFLKLRALSSYRWENSNCFICYYVNNLHWSSWDLFCTFAYYYLVEKWIQNFWLGFLVKSTACKSEFCSFQQQHNLQNSLLHTVDCIFLVQNDSQFFMYAYLGLQIGQSNKNIKVQKDLFCVFRKISHSFQGLISILTQNNRLYFDRNVYLSSSLQMLLVTTQLFFILY